MRIDSSLGMPKCHALMVALLPPGCHPMTCPYSCVPPPSQLRWVQQSLQSVRYNGWKAGRAAARGGRARDGLQHQVRSASAKLLHQVSVGSASATLL